MGTILIAIGIILFVLITGTGVVLVSKLPGMMIMGQTLAEFFKISSTGFALIAVLFAVIGLLIGITFVMIGMNARKINALEDEVYYLKKTLKKNKVIK